MQHGLGVSGVVKITGLSQQHEVGEKNSTATGVIGELFVFNEVQANPSDCQTKTQYQRQSRKNATNSPSVKLAKAEALIAQVAKYQPGDEVARDDEKNIHPNKATTQVFGKCVKDNDDQNSDSS